MSGRVGNMVFSKKDGKTIARSYQPQVANPNSLAQVETRSKLKLASQYAAALGDFGRHYLASMGKKMNDRGALVARIYADTMFTLESGSLTAGHADFAGMKLVKAGDYPTVAPTVALVDDTKITATYTLGTVQEGEVVTLVVVAAPSGTDSGSASLLQRRQAIFVGGSGTAPQSLTATIDVNPAFLGMKHSVVAYVLRSRPSVDMTLSVSNNNRAIGGAQGYTSNGGQYLLQSAIFANPSSRLYSDVAAAVTEVEPE